MCRLFALSGAPHRVAATFWLLEAPDSLAVQSRREPDGVGIGWFDADDTPHVAKDPVAAWQDPAFAREAHELRSKTFVAHLRFASTGAVNRSNTHPFELDQRLFAHNGVVQGLDRLEARLGGDAHRLVTGDTDSERVFALITQLARRNGGDVARAIADAARWIAAELPVFALNVIIVDAKQIWALRYPDTHELWVLERGAGGTSGDRHLEHASASGTIHVRSGELASQHAIVIASERMDEDPGWRLLNAGELLHVSAQGTCTSTIVISDPPAHRLALADLDAQAAQSQAPNASAS